jgi:hypothetical protein
VRISRGQHPLVLLAAADPELALDGLLRLLQNRTFTISRTDAPRHYYALKKEQPMLSPDSRLRVNERHVNASIIDGEAIIINLETGLYFSLDRCGAAAWALLAGGHSIGEAATTLANACNTDVSAVQDGLLTLGKDLLERTLVSISESGASSPVAVDLSQFALGAWALPALNVYDDMGDVLALDPPLPQVEGSAG